MQTSNPPKTGLNSPQLEATIHPNSPLLVLAGAGSGKTRVLVHRIAHWLEQGIPPHAILAVTFTNKAAAEMRSRVESMMHRPINSLWLGTFHGLAHRLLRLHWLDANLPENFQIIDSDDQLRLIKRIQKDLNIDEKFLAPRQAQWFINHQKDEGYRANKVTQTYDISSRQMLQIYSQYEVICNRNGFVDFNELLLRAYELWVNHPKLLSHYQQRFHHILVDEFQDTNHIQYLWLKALAHPKGNITIVGDDDQSIYGWRGAQVENLQHFEKDFKNCAVIKLEQNYRSTATILEAANAVISQNHQRLGKKLWTEGDQGSPILVYQAFNEQEEARFIAARIKDWQETGNWDDCAILYRSNAQSRVLEEALLTQQIPYRIYGGLRFFDRAEIKDALGYLKLCENCQDDNAFERIINTPTRGIGERTIEQIRQTAQQQQISLWQATESMLINKELSGRACSALSQFMEMIFNLSQGETEIGLSQKIKNIISQARLMENYRKESLDKWESRKENLQELIVACSEFDPDELMIETPMTPIQAFLSHAALEAGEQQASEYQRAVQLMTLHSAKGLEFPLIFLAGMEEGLFPHKMSMDDPARLEEERRLAYVGITRAKKQLMISWAEKRRLWGNENYQKVSRFVEEIPAHCRQDVRLNASISRPIQYSKTTKVGPNGFSLGQQVKHPSFGMGTILNFEGEGDQARIHINFENVGSKWLILGYARLEPC